MSLPPDPDPQETQEWLDALDSVLERIPIVAPDRGLEGTDLEPVLDVDRKGVDHHADQAAFPRMAERSGRRPCPSPSSRSAPASSRRLPEPSRGAVQAKKAAIASANHRKPYPQRHSWSSSSYSWPYPSSYSSTSNSSGSSIKALSRDPASSGFSTTAATILCR